MIGLRSSVAALALVVAAGALATPSPAGDGSAFPAAWPDTRAEAVDLLCPAGDSRAACLRARLYEQSGPGELRAPAVRHALTLLGPLPEATAAGQAVGPDGVPLRWIPEAGEAERLALADATEEARAGTLEATLEGLAAARDLLVSQMGLPAPRLAEIVLGRLPSGAEGYLVPDGSHPKRWTLILGATPDGGPAAARRAAVRHYAYAVAAGAGAGLPTRWAEAFSTWAAMTLEGASASDLALLSTGLGQLRTGLFSAASARSAGETVWLAFLHEAYGLQAVRSAVDELSTSQATLRALDRAVRRDQGESLGAALREFQLWALLTGERSDGRHFSFSRLVEAPGFAASSAGLPVLSVHRDEPVGAFGAAQIRLAPQEVTGGLRVHFEGDFGGRWEADLLVADGAGTKHRLPLQLAPEGRGELTVPLDRAREAILLVRNLGGEAHRYTYFAHHDKGFPFEIVELGATREPGGRGAVVVAWDTAAEQDLVGFNVLRRREDGGEERTVNPVWVPALGGFSEQTSYRYVDPGAEPGVAYVYRIEAITTSGLSSFSETAVVAPAEPLD